MAIYELMKGLGNDLLFITVWHSLINLVGFNDVIKHDYDDNFIVIINIPYSAYDHNLTCNPYSSFNLFGWTTYGMNDLSS